MTPERDTTLSAIAIIEAIRDDRLQDADTLISYQEPRALVYTLVRAYLAQALLTTPDEDRDEELNRWRDHVLGQGG